MTRCPICRAPLEPDASGLCPECKTSQPNRFACTRVALLTFDATLDARDAAWKRAGTNEHVLACIRADDLALDAVRAAFHVDTADINSRHHCALADLAFMRGCAH